MLYELSPAFLQFWSNVYFRYMDSIKTVLLQHLQIMFTKPARTSKIHSQLGKCLLHLRISLQNLEKLIQSRLYSKLDISKEPAIPLIFLDFFSKSTNPGVFAPKHHETLKKIVKISKKILFKLTLFESFHL